MKILLVEDDADLSSKLVRLLHSEAFAVDRAADGEEALHLGDSGNYDCAVLDLGLPLLDGVTVLKRWRESGRDYPVIILTARDAWADKAQGFKAGADDYLTKPFLPEELIIRIRALVRRARGQNSETVACGALAHDPQSGGFFIEGRPLRLTGFETRILTTLFRFREQVVDRQKLFDSIYEFDVEIPQNSLEVMIGRLRRKIGGEMIETVRGHGYRLTAGPR